MRNQDPEHDWLLRYVGMGDWVILAGLLYVLGLILFRSVA
jgi:hypothetical protein